MRFLFVLAFMLAPVPAFAQVAISQLPGATTPLGGTEIVPIVQGGVTKNVSVANIQNSGTQTANTVLAAPSGSSGAPTFRAILPQDALWSLPHTANLTTLKALATTGMTAVVRDGYANAGDGGGATYVYSASTCSIASGTGDNGGQVQASGGGCWNIALQPQYNVAIWGVSTGAADNGVLLNAAYNWAAVSGSAPYFKVGPGTFTFTTTFDCHYASGTTLEGDGNATVFYRTGNYGHTFTCGGATQSTQSITVKNLWMQQYIGAAPTTSFINGTTGFGTGYDALGSAHLAFRNMSHLTLDHVTLWNMNFNMELISVIDANISTPNFNGFWDGTNNQTKANLYVDGSDSDYTTGHPQLVHVHNMLTNAYYTIASKTFGTGWTANTVSSFNYKKGAYDDILIKSAEGFTIDGGNALIGAHYANVELRPQGVAGKPILQFRSNDVWYDGAGTTSIAIDNSDATCGNINAATTDVQFNGGLFNGELSTPYAIYVPQNTCNSVYGLQVNGTHATAHMNSPYKLGGVNGGGIFGGSVHGYNILGYNYLLPAESSAVYLYGSTTNFAVTGLTVGGGNSYEAPVTFIGVAAISSGGTGFTANASGTLTWSGANCTTNPVINVTASAGGVLSTTGIATAGSCQVWPNLFATTWTPTGIGAGTATSVAVGPAYTAANQSLFGVSFSAGLVNVRRMSILNEGYYTDFYSQQISCTAGTGAPTYLQNSDNISTTIITNTSSGAVTTGNCAFNGAMSTFANTKVTATDALTSAGIPVAAAITQTYPGGFTFSTASTIGGGGKITFTLSANN